MPYFKNKEASVLFIHIPKTGGTSLEAYFSTVLNIPLNNKSLYLFNTEFNIDFNTSLQHLTYQFISNHKNQLNIDDGYKLITIVRNPYERIISDLFNHNFITINNSKEEVFNIIQTYLMAIDLDNHNIPQYMFVTDINKKLIPDVHILHTETLTMDMHHLGYHDFNVNANVNKNKVDYYHYLNKESIQLINDFYDDDFKIFNYSKII